MIAVSTTCRKVEILDLRYSDLDLFARVIQISRSKTAAGHRAIPLNADAMEPFARLRQRAEALGGGAPDHYVFPACEREVIDFTKPQKSIRTAWRHLTVAAGLKGFRFHDLRHQAITELSEGGASDATIMSVSGHLSKRMLEHYSHVRMAAKAERCRRFGRGLDEAGDDFRACAGQTVLRR